MIIKKPSNDKFNIINMIFIIILVLLDSAAADSIPKVEQCCSCDQTCEPLQLTTDLIAGQHIDIGDISLLVEINNQLNIALLHTTIEWNCPNRQINDVHLWISNEIPPNNFGHWTCVFDEVVNDTSFTCQWNYEDLPCNRTINVGLHMSVCCGNDNGENFRDEGCETAFAQGDLSIPGHHWGTYIEFENCCNKTIIDPYNCTFTQGYWKNHNKYRKKNQYVPWPIDEDTVLCNKTLLEWLSISPKGEPWIRLVHQWIASILNVANGADDSTIATCLLDAYDAIMQCPPSNNDSCHDLLTEFNEGLIGPGHCDNSIPPEYDGCGPNVCLCLDSNGESPAVDGVKIIRLNNNVDTSDLDTDADCVINVKEYDEYLNVELTPDNDNQCHVYNTKQTSSSANRIRWM